MTLICLDKRLRVGKVAVMIKEIFIRTRELPRVDPIYRCRIDLPSDALAAIRALVHDVDVEQFLALPMTLDHRPLGVEVVGRGTVTSCVVDVAQVFRATILMGASGVLVAHNHPHGKAAPGPSDTDVTRKLIAAGRLLCLPLVDHLIIAGDDSFSFYGARTDLWDEQ